MLYNRKVIFIVLFIFGYGVLYVISYAYAQESLKFDPQVTIPYTEFEAGREAIPVGTYEGGYFTATLLPKYVAAIFKFGVWISITLAIFMMMLGGFIWTTAGGAQERVTSAKSYISHAITGLVLALLSYGILEGINPELLRLGAFKIKTASKVTLGAPWHCCIDKTSNKRFFFQRTVAESDANYTCPQLSENYADCPSEILQPKSCCVCRRWEATYRVTQLGWETSDWNYCYLNPPDETSCTSASKEDSSFGWRYSWQCQYIASADTCFSYSKACYTAYTWSGK